jgi:hypothetical protein
MVMQKSVMKYITRMGQKTGMLKNSKKVQTNAMTVAFVAEYQNLNSETEVTLVKSRSHRRRPSPIYTHGSNCTVNLTFDTAGDGVQE